MSFTSAIPRVALRASLAPLLALLASPAFAQTVTLVGDLSGAQEVPPNGSLARGTVVAVVDLTANTLTLELTYDGLGSAETAAHIHGFAPPGVNAGILFALPAGKHKNAVWNYTQSDEAGILAGQTYVNIHSATFPGGEIRAQLVKDPSAVVMAATLDGAQEVPPVPTNATGTGFMLVDTDANTLTFNITYADLGAPETAAHFHGFAPPGMNAGILFGLPAGFHKTGVWNYMASQEAGILGGNVYVNVHSANFPGGEIRGQVLLESTNPTDYCMGKVNSQGCLPQIASTGSPTVSGPDDFFVSTQDKINQQFAVLFWGRGSLNSPFQGGTLCVAPPVIRTPVLNTAGNPAPPFDCSGTLSFHFSHAYMAANGIVPGDGIFAQFWSRDPFDAFGSGLSNAILFCVRP